MPVIVCPSCQARINAKEAAVGRTLSCPRCRGAISVPAPVAELVPEPRRPAQGKSSNTLLWVLLACGGGLLVVCLGCGGIVAMSLPRNANSGSSGGIFSPPDAFDPADVDRSFRWLIGEYKPVANVKPGNAVAGKDALDAFKKTLEPLQGTVIHWKVPVERINETDAITIDLAIPRDAYRGNGWGPPPFIFMKPAEGTTANLLALRTESEWRVGLFPVKGSRKWLAGFTKGDRIHLRGTVKAIDAEGGSERLFKITLKDATLSED